MSVYNMMLGGGSGGWKKSTAVATGTTSLTFPVEHEPTEWISFVISNDMYSGICKLNILRFSEGVGTFWSFSVSSSAARTASSNFDSYLTAQYNGSSLVLQTSSTTFTFHSSATYQLLYR